MREELGPCTRSSSDPVHGDTQIIEISQTECNYENYKNISCQRNDVNCNCCAQKLYKNQVVNNADNTKLKFIPHAVTPYRALANRNYIKKVVEVIPNLFYFIVAADSSKHNKKEYYRSLSDYSDTYIDDIECENDIVNTPNQERKSLEKTESQENVSIDEETSNFDFKYFSTEKSFIYHPFAKDFGPLNIGNITEYILFVEKNITEFRKSYGIQHILVHYSSPSRKNITNAALLACAYMTQVENDTVGKVEQIFMPLIRNTKPYCDASLGMYTYDLTINHCMNGLNRARALGWYNYKTFDYEHYYDLSLWENGDMNWVIPNKFLAFSGPIDPKYNSQNYTINPNICIKQLLKNNIYLVIRLNAAEYNENNFIVSGINHLSMVYPDGSCPPLTILNNFLDVSHKYSGPVGVHCKAGLGRTGTLIGCYAIKFFGFKAGEWIAWNRMCRPGSVLGPQQQFLELYEREVERTRTNHEIVSLQDENNFTIEKLQVSSNGIGKYSDNDQGNRLLKNKTPSHWLKKAESFFFR